MKLEHIVFAVAAKVDVDRFFVFDYVVCRQIQSILLQQTALPTLAIDGRRRDYADSVALQQCIDLAAHIFLADLVRASEMCEAALARWQLSFEH